MVAADRKCMYVIKPEGSWAFQTKCLYWSKQKMPNSNGNALSSAKKEGFFDLKSLEQSRVHRKN